MKKDMKKRCRQTKQVGGGHRRSRRPSRRLFWIQ